MMGVYSVKEGIGHFVNGIAKFDPIVHFTTTSSRFGSGRGFIIITSSIAKLPFLKLVEWPKDMFKGGVDRDGFACGGIECDYGEGTGVGEGEELDGAL